MANKKALTIHARPCYRAAMPNVNTNICLEEAFWKRCKRAALDRRISLNQLVKNGLKLALDDDDTIRVDPNGKATNDLRGKVRA